MTPAETAEMIKTSGDSSSSRVFKQIQIVGQIQSQKQHTWISSETTPVLSLSPQKWIILLSSVPLLNIHSS